MANQPILGITNIPEDIKLSLSGGTLTLKSGSVLTFPDGTTTSITVNKTYLFSVGTSTRMLFYNSTSGNMQSTPVNSCYSGSTAPSGSGTIYWFDTVNSVIKRSEDGGSTWDDNVRSLPIAIIQVTSGSITSINQVFNGFGYMGSTRFVLPNVEGYYPSGKDGFELLFSTIKTDSVLFSTASSSYSNSICVFSKTTISNWSNGLVVVDNLPNVADMVPYRRYYSKADNKIFATTNNTTTYEEKYIAYAYFTTSSSSPYNITSFYPFNPFLSIPFYGVSDYAKYLANLLIIQYNSKPRATQTIQALGRMFPDELILQVRDGFDFDTAVGNQLDILAKYIGVSRSYTDSNNQKAFLTDEEFRVLLKLKIIVNTGSATLSGIEESLYNLFETGIRVVEDKDVNGNQTRQLTYYIRNDWANVGLAAVQQDVLPHPMGVSATYIVAAQVLYFGFIEYTDLSHPYSTGFRDYNDPTKDGEMYAYGKVIN